MAKSKLEYWKDSAWVEAKTIENQNALIRVELEDSLNNAMKANITLGNAAYEPFKEGEAAHADRYGPLTSVFTDFMPIRIIETDSNVVLFHGKVYDIKNIYDKQRGNVVKLYARDHLAELADYPTDDKDAEIKVGAGTNPSILNRSQLIKHIIRDPSTDPQRSSLQISADNIAFADQLKFPPSGRAFSTDHKDSYQINSLGRQGLKAIYEIAKGDPHEVTGDITDYGYDFYGDSRFTLASVTNPALDFNYFKRGTRPIFESTPSAFKGLWVEFPIATEFSETGQKVLMLPDYDFNLPKRDLYTGATAAISRKMVINADTDDEETISRNFNLEFEILEVSSISAAFDWKNRVLVRWNSTKVDGDSATSTTGDVAERLKLSGTSTVVGRIQYQSVTSGSGDPSNGKPAYILISFEPDDLDGGDIITQKKNFNALSGTVTLVGVESGSTFSYNTATGRPSASFGLIRPLRISTSDSKHVDSMRRRIASALSRSKTSRTDCTVRIIPPPFIYVDTTVSSETGSGASAIPTLAIDAQAYGFRAGMTIAKIDSTGEQTAYGYATLVSDDEVVAPLNTGDWDGYTGSEARVRLYFPVRAGHYLYAKNLLANFTGYMFIKSSIYTEEPGMQATMYKGSGVNTAGSPIGLGIDPNAIQATIEGEGNKYPKEVNVPIGGLGYTFEKIDTTRTAKFTSVNQTTISWTGGRMVIGGGGLSYEVVAGSISNLSTSIDNKTNLPVVYKVVFIDPDEQTPDSSGRYTFSFILSSAYKPDHDHIVMAHARASKVSTSAGGKAALIFDGSGLGLYGGIDAAGEDQFTAALFKKSIQPYTTDVAINVGTSGGATKNRHVNSTAGTISFADNNTISVDANTSLDLWTVSGGSSNNNAKTWYIYYKLMNTTPNPDEETSDFTLVNKAVVDRTLVYNDATSDSRGLLAICGTGDTTQTGDNLEEIAIQAFHGKGQNITADTIAANAITADSIKANSLNAFQIVGGLIKTATNTGASGASAGIKISSTGIEGFSGGTTRVFFLDPSTGKATFGSTAQDSINVWGSIGGSGKPADNATVGATWGTNLSNQPTSLANINGTEGSKLSGIAAGATQNSADSLLLNSLVTISIDADGVFGLGNGGNTTDARSAANKLAQTRKLFRQDTLPTPPYLVNDVWITEGYSNDSHKGTSICNNARPSGSGLLSDWTRVSPPATILSANTVTMNGGRLTAGTVTAGTLEANMTLSNIVIAGTGVIDQTSSGGLNGVAMGNLPAIGGVDRKFIVQKAGVDQFRVDDAGNVSIAGTVTIGSIAASVVQSGSEAGATAHQPGAAETRAGGTVGGLTLSAEKIYHGTGTFGHSNTPFFVRGVNEVGGQYGTAGDFSLGDKFVWNESASTLTIDGTVIIGNTSAATIESRANSATQDGDWSDIQAGTDATDVGLNQFSGYSPSGITSSALTGNHTGNVNGLDVSDSSGTRLQFTSTGIHAYNSSTLKATLSASGAAFTAYGTGGGTSEAARQANAALLIVSGNHVSYISSALGNSDMRYDARYHYFYNFGDSNGTTLLGYIRGMHTISLDHTTAMNDITAHNDLTISTGASDEPIYISPGNNNKARFEYSNIYFDTFYPLGSYDNIGGSSNKWYIVYATYIGLSSSYITGGYFTSLTATNTYFSDMSLSNMTHEEGNDFDGTKGDWTIQEGSDDLFIKNNRTGKKYKFKLEEV